MNPFSPGDRVQCKSKSRRHGHVVFVCCGDCDKCKSKSYAECANEPANKVKVIASFPTDNNSTKRYKYDYTELDFEAPLPFKKEKRVPDLSPRDIRPLGSIKLDVPLIVPEEDESETEIEIEVEVEDIEEIEPIVVRRHDKQLHGVSLDEYIGLSQRMNRPI